MKSLTQMKELEAKSEVINDSLWYVNPRDVKALIEATHQAAIEEFKEILEDNRDETLWGDDESNEVMKESIDAFIEAVKDALSPQEPLTDK